MSRILVWIICTTIFGTTLNGCANSRSSQASVSTQKLLPEKPKVVADNLTIHDTSVGSSAIQVVSASESVRSEPLLSEPSRFDDSNSNSSEATPPGSALSLADLEAIAMQSNPTLSQAAAAVDQERGVFCLSSVRTIPKPTGRLSQLYGNSVGPEAIKWCISQSGNNYRQKAIARPTIHITRDKTPSMGPEGTRDACA